MDDGVWDSYGQNSTVLLKNQMLLGGIIPVGASLGSHFSEIEGKRTKNGGCVER